MQLAKLAPDAQRVAHLPLRRTVLELQRLDRDARRQADRQEQEEEARWDQHRAAITRAALGAVHTQLDQHDDRLKAERRDPIGPVVLEIVHAQLDALDEARTVADEPIGALLFNAVEAGVSIRSLIDAWGRRFGPGMAANDTSRSRLSKNITAQWLTGVACSRTLVARCGAP